MGLRLILLFSWWGIISTAFADSSTNKSFLKAGLSLNSTYISKVNLDDEIPYGVGMQTHVGKRYSDWEFSLSSYLVFTYLDDVTFRTPRGRVVGDIDYLNLSFVFLVKRYLGELTFSGMENYIGAGPARSIQSIWFKYATVEDGEFDHRHKMAMEGTGLVLTTGVERAETADYPLHYFEFTYLFNHSEKVSEVGGTATEIEIISSDKTDENYDHTFMLSVGMRVF